MGTAAHPSRRITLQHLLFLPLLLLLFGGCAGTGPVEETQGDAVVLRSSGFPGDWLPAPVGNVNFGDDPAVFTFGWMGMLAGGAAAGWFLGDAVYQDDIGSGGDAVFAGIAIAVVGGMVIGGLLFTAPVKAVEEFFHWLFG